MPLVAACLACHLASGLEAQEPAATRLGAAEARWNDPFSLVIGLRELSDGRVLLADWIEERIVLLDFESGVARDVGAIGAGPFEFRLPGGLLPFRGDSTLLVDLGNARLSILDPQGAIRRTIRPDPPGSGSPRAIDDQGRIYFEQPPWATGLQPGEVDSVRVQRWDAATGVIEDVGVVRASKPRSDAGQPRMTPGIPFTMFAGRDAWGVTGDGRIVFVREGSYVVEWLSADGRLSRGPSHRYETSPVTDDDKRKFVLRFLSSTPISGRGGDGGLGHNAASNMGPEEIRSLVETNEFESEHPYFAPSGVWLTPDGEVWVQRSPVTRSPEVFDVFDDDGRRASRVELPDGRELVGVGRQFVYAVVRSDLELQTLERYPRPR